MMIGELFLFYF